MAVLEARLARFGDLGRMVEICRQVHLELGGLRGGELFADREARPEPLDESLAASMERPDTGVWVGTIDEIVVGYAAVRDETLRDGSHLGVITDLYVEPGARSVGVGEGLVAALIDWCSARGCRGIDAAALPGNRAAKNFFEESGFTARLLVMHHALDPSAGHG